MPLNEDVVQPSAVRRVEIDDPPRAGAVEERFGVMAARRGRRPFRQDDVVITAAADADARSGEDEFVTATYAGDGPQPQRRHQWPGRGPATISCGSCPSRQLSR